MKRKKSSQEFIKYCICSAYINLMKDKPYNTITISDICKEAGFGRTTYYRYFNNDKEELILYIAHIRWQEQKEKDPESAEKDTGRVFLEYVYTNKEFFILMKNHGLDYLLFKMFYNEFGRKKDDNEGSSYEKAFFAGGYFGVIYQWIEENCIDGPEEILKKLFERYLYSIEKEKNSN